MKNAFWIPSSTVVTAPTRYALELSDAKQQLNLLGHADDDTLLVDIIKAAHEYIEALTDTTLITTVYRATFRAFPNSFELTLPRGPVSSVSSITYYDTANASQTWAASNYYLKSDGDNRSRVLLARDQSWPTLYDRWDATTVEYIAGLGESAAGLPARVRQSMRLLVQHWYDNREAVLIGSISKDLEHSLRGLNRMLHSGRFGGVPCPT